MMIRLAFLVEGLIMITISRLLAEFANLLQKDVFVLLSYGYFANGMRRIRVAMS